MYNIIVALYFKAIKKERLRPSATIIKGEK